MMYVVFFLSLCAGTLKAVGTILSGFLSVFGMCASLVNEYPIKTLFYKFKSPLDDDDDKTDVKLIFKDKLTRF